MAKKPKDRALAKSEAKVKKLKKLLKQATRPDAPPVSPLAPAHFPDLPPVDGVRLSTVAAGVRYTGRDDVMLAEIAGGASLAGAFTQSATRAAPVLDCQSKLSAFEPGPYPIAILVNAGNANAFTGQNGADAVNRICAAVASELKMPEDRVFTASTGTIGEVLPDDRIVSAIATLAGTMRVGALEPAAHAIMTTDTFAKGAARTVDIGGTTVTIAGIAKGSGMIAPDMATMLSYVFTDAKVAQPVLQKMLINGLGESFNAITVDGDTSTSDTVMVAATGACDMPQISSARTAAGRAFAQALTAVMKDLALQIVRDGEGATKLVEVRVTGAVSAKDARKAAFAVANSPLVKTAIAGEDPNWGRIVMAVGKSGAVADRDRLTIRFGDILVAEKGWVAADYKEQDAAEYMKGSSITIDADLGVGSASARVWTCDLTKRYIEINADYRS